MKQSINQAEKQTRTLPDNPKAANQVSLEEAVQLYRAKPVPVSFPILQRFKGSNDLEILIELKDRIRDYNVGKVSSDVSADGDGHFFVVTVRKPYADNGISIQVRIFRSRHPDDDPVLLDIAGSNYTLHVNVTGDNPRLEQTIRAAIEQLRQHAVDTPHTFQEKISAADAQDSKARVLADKVKQDFQTDAGTDNVWNTIKQWLPGFDNPEDNAKYGVEFPLLVKKLAYGMFMTVSASTHLLTELCEIWFRTHSTVLQDEKALLPALVPHLQELTDNMIGRHAADRQRRIELSRNTDADYPKKTATSRTTPQLTTPQSIPPQLEITLPDTTKKEPFPFLDMKLSEDAEPKKPDPIQSYWDEILKKEEHQALKVFFQKETAKKKQIRDNLYRYIIFEETTQESATAKEILLKSVKDPEIMKCINKLLTEKKRSPLNVPPIGGSAPKKKSRLSKTWQPTNAIENALLTKFITQPQVDILKKFLGEHSTNRLVSYYRQNNSLAQLLKQIAQLRINFQALTSKEQTPLTEYSIVIDTNIARALLSEDSALEEHEREVKKLAMEALNTLKIKDIRITNMVLAELHEYGNEFLTASSNATPHTPWKLLPGTVDFDDQSFTEDLMLLEKADVGGEKGTPDRLIVAEALHALREKEDTAVKLMTADKGIIIHLFNTLRKPTGDTAQSPIDKTRNINEQIKEHSGTSGTTEVTSFDTDYDKLHGRLSVFPIDTTTEPASKLPPPISAEALDVPSETKISTSLPHPIFGEKVGDTGRTIQHLFELIGSNGGTAMIVGGAVRDLEKGGDIVHVKDIDIATDLDIENMYRILKESAGFKKEPIGVVKLPGLHLIQIAPRSKRPIDITCREAKDATDKLSMDNLAKDARKRDLAMNALYMDMKGHIHDPLKTGINDAKQSNITVVSDSFLKGKETYQIIGRILKFWGRKYKMESGHLAEVRRKIVEHLQHARSKGEVELAKLSDILDKAREFTPMELIDCLQQMGISDRMIRILFPDVPRGFYYGDQTAAYGQTLSPNRLEVPAADSLPDKAEVRVDTEHGRVYQYRVLVRAEKTQDPLMIDIDMTNHDTPGHWGGHYHVYRWIKDKWEKHANGMSPAGEAGMPDIDGGIYKGPQPWVWADLKEPTAEIDSLVAQLNERLRGEMVVSKKDEHFIDFNQEIEIHVDKVKDLIQKDKLATLLMIVKNIMKRGKMPDRQDMAARALTTTGGERLRFEKQFDDAIRFVNSLLKENLPEPGSLQEKNRLFDLYQYRDRDPEVLRKAAEWAASMAKDNIVEFTHLFEAHVALDGEIEDKGFQTQPTTAEDRKTSLSPSKEEHAQEIKKNASTLSFPSENHEKYHYYKHKTGFLTDKECIEEEYIGKIREVIAAQDKPQELIEQTGARSYTYVDSGLKVVVRVDTDNKAYIATGFRMDEREKKQEERLPFKETVTGINDHSSLSSSSIHPSESLLPLAPIGGIMNYGNICYIASVMQIIANTPEYYDFFYGRFDESGKTILSNISQGITTSFQTVNTFRDKLFEMGFGMPEEKIEQQDAAELLTFLLSHFNYHTKISELKKYKDSDSTAEVSHEQVASLLILSGLSPHQDDTQEFLHLMRSYETATTETLDSGATRTHTTQLLSLPDILT